MRQGADSRLPVAGTGTDLGHGISLQSSSESIRRSTKAAPLQEASGISR